MYLVREVMHCKPGQVQPLVNLFQQVENTMQKKGFGSPARILTDISGEQYWTLISEREVDNLEQYAEQSRQIMTDPDIKNVMKDYHNYVESGRREIYKIETPGKVH